MVATLVQGSGDLQLGRRLRRGKAGRPRQVSLRSTKSQKLEEGVVVPDFPYNRFLAENDPTRKNEAGKDLIRAIFGKDAIAEDSIRQPASARLAASAEAVRKSGRLMADNIATRWIRC
jgi:hypothetical protein